MSCYRVEAKKRFNADKELQKRKFELALPKVLAIVGAIARKFGVCLFSACRIRECCTLFTQDIYTPKGNVRPRLVIRKSNTKGKLATRSIPVIEDLRRLLSEYYPLAGEIYLFPGRSDGHLCEDSASRILRGACKQVGIIGVSSHSFRRSALSQMSNAGIPLRVIQEISGHRNLEQLQRYLEVTDEQVLGRK